MKRFQDKQKAALIKKLHTMVTKAGIKRQDYLAMLSAYNAESSKELNVYELTELCSKVDYTLNKTSYHEQDKWRKRVMAAVGAYLGRINKESNSKIIIGIACRAAEMNDFNSIPITKLRAIYNAFGTNNRVLDSVEVIKLEDFGYAAESKQYLN